MWQDWPDDEGVYWCHFLLDGVLLLRPAEVWWAGTGEQRDLVVILGGSFFYKSELKRKPAKFLRIEEPSELPELPKVDDGPSKN